MAKDRLRDWETLFQRALLLVESAAAAGCVVRWSFGGGTVLMRRHGHRFSKDVDIFVPDPQILGFLNPKLNDAVGEMTASYIDAHNFLKLQFAEGEIDFIASEPLTENPTQVEVLFGREINVETTAEIIAKKVWHRGSELKARDLFDLSMVAEREPEALREIEPILRDRRAAILSRLASRDAPLRAAFAQLEVLDYRPDYDHCLSVVQKLLGGLKR